MTGIIQALSIHWNVLAFDFSWQIHSQGIPGMQVFLRDRLHLTNQERWPIKRWQCQNTVFLFWKENQFTATQNTSKALFQKVNQCTRKYREPITVTQNVGVGKLSSLQSDRQYIPACLPQWSVLRLPWAVSGVWPPVVRAAGKAGLAAEAPQVLL